MDAILAKRRNHQPKEPSAAGPSPRRSIRTIKQLLIRWHLVVLWLVVVLLVGLEEAHQVWQLEGELVHAELQLERWQLDELLLLVLVVLAVLVGHHAGDQSEDSEDDDDLCPRFNFSRLVSFSFFLSFFLYLSFLFFSPRLEACFFFICCTHLLVHFEFGCLFV